MSNEPEKTKGAVSLKVLAERKADGIQQEIDSGGGADLAEDHCPEHAVLIEYLRNSKIKSKV